MPSLQEQLTEIEKKEANHKLVLDRFTKLDKAIVEVKRGNGCLIPFVACATVLILSSLIIPKKDFWSGIVICVYASLILAGVLNWVFEQPNINFLHWYYRISKKEYKTFSNFKKEFAYEKASILNKIKAEQKVIDAKLYEEKKIAYRIEEGELVYELNKLIGIAQGKELPNEKIIELLTQLELQKIKIRNFGYQLYTHTYYNNRFTKLNQELVRAPREIDTNVVTPTKPVSKVENNSGLAKPTIVPPVTKIETPKPIIILQNVIEKPISELVPLPAKPEITPEKTTAFRLTPKQDFEKLNTQRHEIGKLGEEFVYNGERKQLWDKQLFDLSDNVKWVSQDSDAYGYDIVSFEDDGTPKYIEVKTTTGNKQTPFYLSEVELNAMNTLENYVICRVYNWNSDSVAKYTVKKDRLVDFFDLEPQSYKVKPKF